MGFALKGAVSVGLIWYLVHHTDLSVDPARFFAVAPGYVALAVLVSVLQVAICVFRWRAVLIAIGQPLPLGTVTRLFLIGAFFNQALPSSVGGDAFRIYLAHKQGQTLGGAFNGVMLERVAIVAAIPLLAAFMLPWLLPRLHPDAVPWAIGGVALMAVGSAVGIAILTLLERLPRSIRHWRLVSLLMRLGGDARRLFLTPRHAAAVFAWSVIGHANVSLTVYVLAAGLGVDIGLVDCLALFPLVLLATTIPVSIGGWGVREGAMIAAFALVGVPREDTFVVSVLFGLLAVAVSLPGGLVWLLSRQRPSMAAVEDEVQRAAEGPAGLQS
jgi:hypothetical protein